MTIKLNTRLIKHMLADRDMTARDLAAAAAISEATMYRLMGGEAFSSITLGKLAAALQCEPGSLITATEPEEVLE